MNLFHGPESLYGNLGILSSSWRVKGTRVRFRKFSSSSVSPRNPSEGNSNAWTPRKPQTVKSQELRPLSGLREIFLVKVIIDWLNPQGAKPNHEVDRGTRRWVWGRKTGGRERKRGKVPPARHSCCPSSIPSQSGCLQGTAMRSEKLHTSL